MPIISKQEIVDKSYAWSATNADQIDRIRSTLLTAAWVRDVRSITTLVDVPQRNHETGEMSDYQFGLTFLVEVEGLDEKIIIQVNTLNTLNAELAVCSRVREARIAAGLVS